MVILPTCCWKGSVLFGTWSWDCCLLLGTWNHKLTKPHNDLEFLRKSILDHLGSLIVHCPITLLLSLSCSKPRPDAEHLEWAEGDHQPPGHRAGCHPQLLTCIPAVHPAVHAGGRAQSAGGERARGPQDGWTEQQEEQKH